MDPVAAARGCAVAGLPERYGHWQSIYQASYQLFRRWQRERVWALLWVLLQTFADAAGLITWRVSVDFTINRRARPDPGPASGLSRSARARSAAVSPGPGAGRQGLHQLTRPTPAARTAPPCGGRRSPL